MAEDEDEEEAEGDESDGSDEDECGAAVSITSPEEEGDPEGKRNSMSPCLPKKRRWENGFAQFLRLSQLNSQISLPFSI